MCFLYPLSPPYFSFAETERSVKKEEIRASFLQKLDKKNTIQPLRKKREKDKGREWSTTNEEEMSQPGDGDGK
jgi:hypothetical protein